MAYFSDLQGRSEIVSRDHSLWAGAFVPQDCLSQTWGSQRQENASCPKVRFELCAQDISLGVYPEMLIYIYKHPCKIFLLYEKSPEWLVQQPVYQSNFYKCLSDIELDSRTLCGHLTLIDWNTKLLWSLTWSSETNSDETLALHALKVRMGQNPVLWCIFLIYQQCLPLFLNGKIGQAKS